MKPVSIRISAFGPYLKEQFIDFSDLTASGIFLISGETGSGKTIILDAMTYALYGKSSGGGRGDIYAMRCTNASEDDETAVEYVFDIHGKRYKFIRTLKFGRKKLNSQQNVFAMNDEGIYEPMFENPKQSDLEKTAETLLGLTYEQFRQVIILPQGQFEQLLTSNSKDKEKILTSLFGTEKWDRAARILCAEATERMNDINKERSGIAAVLEENGCKSPEELFKLLEKKQEELLKNESELEKSSAELEKIKDFSREQEKIADKFFQLEKSEKEFAKFAEKDSKIEKEEKALKISLNAEKIKPAYDALKSARSEKKLRAEDLKSAKTASELCEKALDAVSKKYDELKNKKYDFDKKEKEITALSDLTETYRRTDELLKGLTDAENTEKSAKSQALKLSEKNEKAKSAVKELEIEKAQLYKEYSAAVEKYTAELCSSLAEGLSEGEPCPVCGSTEHPKKAAKSQKTVTEEDLKALKKKIDFNEDEINRASAEQRKVFEKLERANADYLEKRSESEKLRTEYDVLTEKTDKNIKSAAELEKKINALAAETKKYISELNEAEKSVKKLSEENAVKTAAVKTAEAEKNKAEQTEKTAADEFEKLLKKHSFGSEEEFLSALISERERLETEKAVSEHRINKESALKNISALKSELSEKKKPDTEKIRAELEEAEAVNKKLVELCALAKNEEKRLKKLCMSVKKQSETLKKQSEKAEMDLIFTKRLRGDNGISLQRYILGIMLSSVITAANKLLENVHGGRYKLYRSDESSGSARIKGLEFSVYDRFSAKRRSVSTLSGGEKFLAALSLSIGLSSVIRTQSGGIEMGAMFIDEGFGTLDSASVSDALSVLGTMKRSDAVIGIISHVGILKENISAGIEITKTEKGSSLKVKK